ncbi:MAG: DinB family protein [Bacillus sp. (in: firmicutes)]
MLNAKDILTEQLLANATESNWYASFQLAVKGLEEKEAFWKPNEKCHNIAEIVQHLIFWNATWQKRYIHADVKAVALVTNNKDTFIVPEGKEFFQLKGELLELLLAWKELFTEEQLESEVKGTTEPGKWGEVIAHAITHNAYHIGQIVYIRKMQQAFRGV